MSEVFGGLLFIDVLVDFFPFSFTASFYLRLPPFCVFYFFGTILIVICAVGLSSFSVFAFHS